MELFFLLVSFLTAVAVCVVTSVATRWLDGKVQYTRWEAVTVPLVVLSFASWLASGFLLLAILASLF